MFTELFSMHTDANQFVEKKITNSVNHEKLTTWLEHLITIKRIWIAFGLEVFKDLTRQKSLTISISITVRSQAVRLHF